jgi:glycosyltransferase 2 family protein
VKRAGAVFALAGFALAVLLFAREDLGAIVRLLIVAGPGLVLAALVHVVPMTLNAAAWQALFPKDCRVTLRALTHATWLRESVNGLLPVARVGGEIVAYRIVRARGVPAADAASTLVADMAISVITQAGITFLGLAILLRSGVGTSLAMGIAGAAALLMVAGLVFVHAQRAGVVGLVTRLVDRAFAGRFEGAVEGSVKLDCALRTIYARRRDVAACALWQCVGWIAGSAEIWLALYFLGHERGLVDAVMIEALIQAITSAAFVVPGALGLQEGAFLVLGAAVGLDGGVALALATARRLRDVVVFLPGLIAWHWAESRVPAPESASGSR